MTGCTYSQSCSLDRSGKGLKRGLVMLRVPDLFKIAGCEPWLRTPVKKRERDRKTKEARNLILNIIQSNDRLKMKKKRYKSLFCSRTK